MVENQPGDQTLAGY